jgi:hypothetical protein
MRWRGLPHLQAIYFYIENTANIYTSTVMSRKVTYSTQRKTDRIQIDIDIYFPQLASVRIMRGYDHPVQTSGATEISM